MPAPIASILGAVDTPGRPAQPAFQLQTGRFQGDRPMPMLLGLDVQPAPGSAVRPQIRGVTSVSGLATYNLARPRGPLFVNVQVPLLRPTTYEVQVQGLDRTTGGFVVEVTLPGDADGNGVVDRADMARVRLAYGTIAGMTHFDPGADVNQDGRVGVIDYSLTHRNEGATASVVSVDRGNGSARGG